MLLLRVSAVSIKWKYGGCLEAEIVLESDSRVRSVPDTYAYTYILYIYIICINILWYYMNSGDRGSTVVNLLAPDFFF